MGVTWKLDEQRDLPTPDQLLNIDYTRGISDEDPGGQLLDTRLKTGPPSSSRRTRKNSMRSQQEEDGGQDARVAGAVMLTVPGAVGGAPSRSTSASPVPFA